MKNIQTSNYARKGSDPFSIAISATVPPWYTGKRLDCLAPTWQLVEDIHKGKLTSEQYETAYLNLLLDRQLTPQKILDILPQQCFLLCYESPHDKCHRRTLANWIKTETGVDIAEWKNADETAQEKQQNMVDNLLDF